MASASSDNIGIMMDSRSITVVQTRSQGGRMEVIQRGSVQTPAGAIEGASIRDPFRAAQAIRAVLRELNLRAKTVSVALPSQGYSLRSVRLPDVPAAERRALVRNELEELGALPPRSGTFDFLWIPVPSEPGKRMVDAVSYYASDPEVDQVRDTLRQAGLRLGKLEPASVAAIRAYLASRPAPGPVAVVVVAQKHSDLCIHDGSTTRSMRRIPSGWDDLLPAQRAASPFYTYEDENDVDLAFRQGAGVVPPPVPFDLPRSDAGPLGGFPEDAAGPYAPSPDPGFGGPQTQGRREAVGLTAHSRASALNGEFLASELARSLAFFAREYPDAARPKSLVLLAPEFLTEPLARILETAMPLPVETPDPLAAFDMPRALPGQAEEAADNYLPAIGAALAGDAASLPTVDLSQQEEMVRVGRRAPVMLLAGMAGSTLWMVAAAIASITLTVLESNERTESGRITSRIAQIKAERAPLLKRAEINAAAKNLEAKSKVPASSVLGRVAAATPPGISVTRIEIGVDGKVAVEGNALNTITMQQFALNLGQSAAIKYPGYEMMRQDDKGGLSFRISGATRNAAAASGAAPDRP